MSWCALAHDRIWSLPVHGAHTQSNFPWATRTQVLPHVLPQIQGTGAHPCSHVHSTPVRTSRCTPGICINSSHSRATCWSLAMCQALGWGWRCSGAQGKISVLMELAIYWRGQTIQESLTHGEHCEGRSRAIRAYSRDLTYPRRSWRAS